ncbi:MAG TPA: sugar ABC transporter permease [Bacilli bacterium]|jgi:ABC-type sugar transport system permease subunit|nr:sugar ABC transporter permease [Bacilli bacterium]HOE06646.1 sugar ABC transporter permease [Bacilli bacterium]HOR17772.1 sugar ABC transporter permease [Bacilli bacterium]HPL55275.1 sugar ABC transporter permease [Bacilli bacterium]HQM07043.1 sugar ABC transporter permease [Bacilli bacterium]
MLEKQSVLKKFSLSISNFFSKLGQTTFMKKVKAVFNYIPNLLVQKVSYRNRKALWGIVFVIPLMIGLIYFFLIPFITTVIYSFSNVEMLGYNSETNEFIGVITEWVGLDNYRYIWNEHATFKQYLLDSFVNTMLNVPLILIFSLLVAVVLNSKFKGRAFVRAVFFMPVIFNSQAVDVAMASGELMAEAINEAGTDIFATMFNFQDFLLDANLPVGAVTFLANASNSIFDIISFSGVQILIFLSGIQSVPKHLYEAAKIEGATQYEIFWKITFPMVSPLMLTAGVYTVVDSFLRSEVLKAINRIKGAGVIKLVNGLGNLTNYGVHAAMSWLFCISSLIIIGIVVFLLSRMVFYYDE